MGSKSEPLADPARVGRYELLFPIASGGMATVYLARTQGLGGFEREVALKLTHAHLRREPQFAGDLLEEAKLVARIRHVNVVPVLDVGDDEHGVFLVMEYIEGDSLSGLMRRSAGEGRPLAPGVGLRILIDALQGLHAAHELRTPAGQSLELVHRDFSPQNILVGLDGVARLTDFGIAKAATRLGQTATGLVKGKVNYMSPEQVRGDPLDRRCDVWAAGVVAWELLTGRRLFKAGNDVSVILKLVTEVPPAPSSVAPDIPAAFDAVVASALSGDPATRCPSAAELARRLQKVAVEHGMLASAGEVAEVVREVAGAKLTEQRRRIDEESQRLATHGGDAATLKTPSSNVLAGRPGPSKPVAPVAETRESAPIEGTGLTNAAAVTSASRATARIGRRKLALVGVLSLSAAAALAFIVVRAGPSAKTPEVLPSAIPVPRVAAEGVAPSAAAAAARAAGAAITFESNAPVKKLVVAGEPFDFAEPLESPRIEIAPRAPGTALRVEATAGDGRRTSTTFSYGAAQVTLSFAEGKAAAPIGPATRPRPPTTRPPSSPIPASPYGK